jgi:hypothetical protein
VEDKRSAVLGKANKRTESPVGALEMAAQIPKWIGNVFDRAENAEMLKIGALAPAMIGSGVRSNNVQNFRRTTLVS